MRFGSLDLNVRESGASRPEADAAPETTNTEGRSAEGPAAVVPTPAREYRPTRVLRPGPREASREIPHHATPPSAVGDASSPRFTFLLPPVEPDEVGRLGNYRVLRLLEQGGMGFVFLAEDIALHRQVALKVLRPDLAESVDGWQRFLREARLMAAIKHDHLVTVFQVGQESNVIYLAMELLEGETLEDWVTRRGPAEPADILRIGREIAAGLAVLHQRGLLHRDIKPSNLWLEAPGQRIKILDLGLARSLDDASVTRPGIVVGTPAFMSPEQARAERLDARSDLFSLGGVLYYLATGTDPFGAQYTLAVLTALVAKDPRPVHELNPRLPRALADLIMQLLAKDPEKRPGSAEAVHDLLRQIEDGSASSPARPEQGSHTQQWPRPSPGPARWKRAFESRRWKKTLGAVVLVTALGAFAAPALVRPLVEFWMPPAGAYLSEMEPVATKDWINQPPHLGPGRPHGPRPHGPDGPHGPPPPWGFPGVMVAGKPSPHGIFMHPPLSPRGGTARLTYGLDKRFARFQAQVSLNDGPPQSDTPISFSVYGDDRLLWKSNPIQSQADAQTCSISVQEVEILTIEIDCPGEPRGGHAVWIEPYVAR